MTSEAHTWHSRLTRSDLAVAAFTTLYMAAALTTALVVRNQEFVFYFVVMCLLIAAVGWTHWRVGFHPAALWGLSIWGLTHMAGGLAPVPLSWPVLGEQHVLYNLWLIPGWLKYDQLVHAYGFGLVTWICWQCLQRTLESRGQSVQPTLGLLTFCAAAGMGFGAANEVVEFIATLLLPGTNVGGYANTGWDLVANTVGSVLSAIVIRCTARQGA